MVQIAKTELTLQLERDIWEVTHKRGVFGCFEVTIGWYGEERVDYLTYDTNGVWRCYEIKISKSDFNSKNHNTFIGNYNYYVMTPELYTEVKNEIPGHIGVYIGSSCKIKSKRQELSIDEQVLKDSLIRCLSREAEKVIKSAIPTKIERLQRQLRQAEKDKEEYRSKYWDLMRIGQEKYGSRWYKDY